MIAVMLAVFVAGVAVVQGWLGSSFLSPDKLVPLSPFADADVDYDRGVASPSPQRWAKKKSLDEELGFAALELESPDTSFGASALKLSSSPSPPPKKKGKKSVAFAEELNEVYEVEKWFDRRIHKHREIRFRWGYWQSIEVSRWIEPDGHNQLHFPRTKWVRDVPDWSVEDQDGDVEMGEDGDVEMGEN